MLLADGIGALAAFDLGGSRHASSFASPAALALVIYPGHGILGMSKISTTEQHFS